MTETMFDTYVAFLRARLAEGLPGTEAQLTMAPAYRQNRVLARVQGKRCREAGVMALLFPVGGEPHVLLTARRAHLSQHAGQISFPGGRLEPGETHLDAALRETYEEVDLPPARVEVLGALTPLYIPPSNYCVHPFVGAVPEVPDLTPHDHEVEAILSVPLLHLLDPGTRIEEIWELRGQRVGVPFYRFEDYQIWGATAMMLAELLLLCGEV